MCTRKCTRRKQLVEVDTDGEDHSDDLEYTAKSQSQETRRGEFKAKTFVAPYKIIVNH